MPDPRPGAGGALQQAEMICGERRVKGGIRMDSAHPGAPLLLITLHHAQSRGHRVGPLLPLLLFPALLVLV